MKLLILTQKVDSHDAILGFFHRWIEEFAKHCERVTVICLEKGTYDLPENVKVLSLGKEEGKGRLAYLLNFYTYIWRERRHYDRVFVHMNQMYVILGFVWWKLWRKRTALWYVHRATSLSLRVATFLVDVVFSASSKSFRIKTGKLRIVGHGIDTTQFSLAPERTGVYRMVTAGRISPTKNIDRLIEITRTLDEGELIVAGEPVTVADQVYLADIQESLRQSPCSRVSFRGALAHEEMPEFLRSADLFLNLSDTGSLDKAVLEAMAAGLEILTANAAFHDLLSPTQLTTGEVSDAVSKIKHLMGRRVRREDLRSMIISQHSLKKLIPQLLNF
jgi:glycosyltransferase involved in cell wall biosynthesis